jgi:hypothetical protein
MRALQLPEATGIDALVKVDVPAKKPGQRQMSHTQGYPTQNYQDAVHPPGVP